MDKFPEAFRRFEQVVDVDRIRSFRQLESAFDSWAGSKWEPTRRQLLALSYEARRLGIPLRIARRPTQQKVTRWRTEKIEVKGRSRTVYRDTNTGRFIKKPRL